MPTEKYASATEIFGYCQLLGQHFGLYEHALFQTEVESLTWDDDAHRWDLATKRGDRIRTQFFVSAGGLMHKAKLPGIDGIDRFAGKAFHTTRWDYDYTGGSPTEPMDHLADKVVGHHRHRRDLGAGRAAAGPVGQGGLRLPAHALGGRRAGPAADRRDLVPLAPAGVAGRAHPQLHPGGHRPASPTATWSADGWGQALGEDTQREPGLGGGAGRARGHRLRGHGGLPATDRRGHRGPRDRREAQALVRQALQAHLLPRRLPRDVQRAERAPGRHRRPWGAGDVRRRAGRRRHRVPARPAGVRVGVRDHDRPRRPPRVRPGRPRRGAAERALARRHPLAARRADRRVPELLRRQLHPGRLRPELRPLPVGVDGPHQPG